MDHNRKPTMRHGLLAIAFLASLVVALWLLPGGRTAARAIEPSPARAGQPTDRPTDQLMIRFAPIAGRAPEAAARQQLLDRMNAAAGTTLTFVRPMSGDAFVYRLPKPLAVDQVAAIARDLAALPEIDHAEPDIIMRHTGVRMVSPLTGTPRAADQSPNDPGFADQWHYRYTPGDEEGANLEPAWAITTGSADVVVAVIDTGITGHADLAGRTVPGYDFITNPATANDGDGRDPDPSDPGDWNEDGQCGGDPFSPSSWHGTHVAGTIGAATNNGDDVAGVNWQAKIQPVRVLGRCGGNPSDIIDAIRWAAGLNVPGVPANANPARVLNLSLGGSGTCSVLMQGAVNDAVAAGAVVVVAAGNSSDIADFYTPASCKGVITVAATDRYGWLAWYSNYGSTVEISAPGGDTWYEEDGILSTLNSGTRGPAADSLAFYQGTSMAAPHVAGVAALLLGEKPGLTPAQVSELLQDSARDFPDMSDCTTASCGDGMLDAYLALLALGDGGPTATPTKTATPSPTPTKTPTPLPTATDGPSPTPLPTTEATVTPSPMPSPTTEATPSPTIEATPSPTSEATPSPTIEATPSPTATLPPIGDFALFLPVVIDQ